jgi:hypothetical protein
MASSFGSKPAVPFLISNAWSSVKPFIFAIIVCADTQYTQPLIWLLMRFTTSFSLPVSVLLRFCSTR